MDPKTQTLKDKFKTKLKNTMQPISAQKIMSGLRAVSSPFGFVSEAAKTGAGIMNKEIEKRKTLPPITPQTTPTQGGGGTIQQSGGGTQTYVPTNVATSNEPGSMSGYLRPTQTPQTPSYYADKVEQYSQLTPEEKAYLAQNRELQYKKTLAAGDKYAEMDMRKSPVDLTTPDLVGRLPGTQGLFDQQINRADLYASIPAQVAGDARKAALEGYQGLLGSSMPQLGTAGQVPFSPIGGSQGPILGTQGGQNGLLVQGNIQMLPKLQENYNTMRNNMGSINGIEGLLSGVLGGDQNIYDINKLNKAINSIKKNTSSQEYNQFQTLTSSLGQLYSAYFSGSGQETDTTRQIGQSLIDGTASAETIKSVLELLKQEGGIRLNQLHSNINNISSNPSYLGAPNTNQNQGGGYAEQW